MGRREADSRGAMSTNDRSELGCLRDAASSGHRAGEESPRPGSRRPCSADKRQRNPDMEAVGPAPSATAPMEVKKHQHKHNLKHRYEVMETLGKGTYGKVKRAVERASLKTEVTNVQDEIEGKDDEYWVLSRATALYCRSLVPNLGALTPTKGHQSFTGGLEAYFSLPSLLKSLDLQ